MNYRRTRKICVFIVILVTNADEFLETLFIVLMYSNIQRTGYTMNMYMVFSDTEASLKSC